MNKEAFANNFPILDVMNLSKRYSLNGAFGKPTYFFAVRNVSFSLNKNECIGLVGESGSGKTTLGRMLARLERPSKGNIVWKSKNISFLKERELKPFRKQIQMIFQDPFTSLNPKWRTLAIVGEGLKNFFPELSNKEQRDRVSQIVCEIGLSTNDLDKYPYEFSGGQRQRIAIARSLILNPDLLICDEIVSALDVSIRGQIINLLKTIKEKKSLSLMFITHDLPLANMVSDKTMIMFKGEIVEIVPKGSLFSYCQHPYTQMLLNPLSHSQLKKNVSIEKEKNPTECAFVSFCPYRQEICSLKKPELQDRGNNHWISCHIK